MKFSQRVRSFSTVLCALWLCVALASGARAHGGEDHGDEPVAATVAAGSGTTQTALELHLEDLNASSAGTSAPLIGAKVRGFLKHDDGDLLSRITVAPEETPGFYAVRFGDQNAYRFGEAGTYLLELNIQPASGDAVNTIIAFELPAVTPPISLGKRALPFVLGALVLLAVFVLIRKIKRSGGAKKNANLPLALLLLCALGLAASIVQTSWAHGGEDHGEEEPVVAATSGTATGRGTPEIQIGQVSATKTAGRIRVTVIAQTQIVAAQVLAPGEVELPASTAQLLQIKTAPVEVAQLSTGITFSGQIAPDPNGTVRVASIVPGRVVELSAAQGDRVQSGQVLAVVESRAIGEAQSAFQQAQARFRNAQSNLDVVQQQAKAGVFSRAPLEVAQKAQGESSGDVRQQSAAVQQAQVALDNATRVARVGGFAAPALEAAKNNQAQVREALQTAQAAQSNAQAAVAAAQAELARRQQQAKAGVFVSRPTQEAQRVLVAAQAARAAAQSEVATTRANLSRAKMLAAEGLVSQRDLETANNAFDTATARLETAGADEKTAQQELERQQQLASTNVAGVAEVQAAQSTLAGARADVQTRRAQVQSARSQLQVADVALSRERAIVGGGIANRRELETARANLQAARAGLFKAQRARELADATLSREQSIFRKNLNNTAQVQQARAGFVAAQADLRAAQSTLALLKSSPGASVQVPIRAPRGGIVQTREVAVGELVQADAPLFTIVDLQSVALEAALFENDFARVRIGSPVTITTDALPKRRFSGRISFLGSQVDAQTRTVTARALISNPGELRPGMFARGQIQTGTGNLSVVVPASAVLEDGAAKIVFVPRGDKYVRREVLTGAENDGRIEIKIGLKQGDSVVVSGAAALRAQAAKGV